MVNKTWWLTWFLVTILFSFSTVSVSAATPTKGFKIWPAKTTTEVNKVWTIDFNNPLSSKSINESTIFVTDSKQKKVSTTKKLSTDGLTVTVTPSKAYEAGDYNLYITNEVTSVTDVKHDEFIIIPFTVQVTSRGMSSATLVVTVTKDSKDTVGDLSGVLSLEDPSGTRLSAISKDIDAGKYTFYIYDDGDYSLKYFNVENSVCVINGTNVENSVINTQSIKLPTIKLPVIKEGIITITPTVTTKTASLTLATKEGVVARKSGSIGGQISIEQYGVPITVSNKTSTWTTRTDMNGNFVVYLPTGSYQLDIDGIDTQYKKHSYKLTVAAGQMASPQDIVNVEETIGTLGLKLDAPVYDFESALLGGISSTTKQISGSVNADAVVEIYDIAPATPKLIVTSKPDKEGKFVAKLSNLSGKKLQLKVIDSAKNVYILSMISVIT
ncbi:MAG: hypothetical protein APF81_00105 [Desulfosporosinus sp. BRH_c37]|nr:MAG: hypothetical protein APF81_00105 [Desulfosporosinus sp. BRH_c37]